MTLVDHAQVEVELKFEVQQFETLLRLLEALQLESHGVIEQVDEYFAHPSRNLRKSDETLRIRTGQGKSWLTYKGPKLSKRTKIREEIEIPLTTLLAGPNSTSFPSESDLSDVSEPAELALRQILLRMGFRSLAIVRKMRHVFTATTNLEGKDWQLSVGLDRVEQIGTFVEIETLCERSQWRAAEMAVWHFARQLGLSEPIKCSYLALSLHQQDD